MFPGPRQRQLQHERSRCCSDRLCHSSAICQPVLDGSGPASGGGGDDGVDGEPDAEDGLGKGPYDSDGHGGEREDEHGALGV